MTETATGRGWSARRWVLVAALGLAGLLAVLVGVALLVGGEDAPCGCTPAPSPTAASSAA